MFDQKEEKLISAPQQVDELSLSLSDEELLKLAQDWKGMAGNLTGDMKKWSERAKGYYMGKYVQDVMLDDGKSNVAINRIFTNVETIIPMCTSKPAVPVVYPATNTDESKEYATIHQKVLTALYKQQGMQRKTEIIARHNQIYKLGVLKYGIKDGKITTDYVIPTNLILDPNASTIEDSEFIGERIKTTANSLAEFYPKHKEYISKMVGGKMGTAVELIEWWTDDYKFCVFKDKVLEKKKNPHFHYGETETKTDEYGVKHEIQDVRYNFFDKPKKPYIFLQVYTLGDQIPDRTTPLHLSIVLQDDVNQRKRQLADNAEIIGNPIRTFKGFTQKQIDQIQSNLTPGDAIFLQEGQEVSYIQAAPLPSYVTEDMIDSKNEIDNLFGTHSTTRGERDTQETARGREILRAGDEDRQSTIGRAMERVLTELYRAWTHLIKVYYVDEQIMPILGKDKTTEYLKISRNNIEDGMEVDVEAGSTIPDDKIAQRAEAIQLRQLQSISTQKLYERLGWENPMEEATKFHQEQAQAQIDQQELLAQGQQKQAMAQQEVNMAPKMMQQIQQQIEQLGQEPQQEAPTKAAAPQR